MSLRRIRLLLGLAGLIAGQVHAQNVGGVFGPVVDEGHRSLQYRVGYDPEGDRFAQRLHYQHAISDRNMWRIVVQSNHQSSSAADFYSLAGEWFWQLTPDSARWQQGLRFDFRMRNDDRPNAATLNWMNEVRVSDNWRVRLVLQGASEVGNDRRSGVLLGARSQLAHSLSKGRQWGIQLYSLFGTTREIPKWSDQLHQLGPYFSMPLGDRLGLLGRVLIGLTESTPNLELGIWLNWRI